MCESGFHHRMIQSKQTNHSSHRSLGSPGCCRIEKKSQSTQRHRRQERGSCKYGSEFRHRKKQSSRTSHSSHRSLGSSGCCTIARRRQSKEHHR
jgi:hypothetical protein